MYKKDKNDNNKFIEKTPAASQVCVMAENFILRQEVIKLGGKFGVMGMGLLVAKSRNQL